MDCRRPDVGLPGRVVQPAVLPPIEAIAAADPERAGPILEEGRHPPLVKGWTRALPPAVTQPGDPLVRAYPKHAVRGLHRGEHGIAGKAVLDGVGRKPA